MYEDIASEIWNELRRFVNSVDRQEAAEIIVNILIDNDCSADDIKDAFVGDAEIKKALAIYAKHEDIEEQEEEEDEEDDEYDDQWEN